MVTQNHGKGLGGGFSTFRLAPCQSSEKNARRPANQTGLNVPCSLILTGVSLTKSLTAWDGMMKLKPCTMLPSGPGVSETKVSTPMSSEIELTAGPPEFPQAAGASVWITG